MELSECRRRFAEHIFVDANVVHDTLTCGWHGNFRDAYGNEYPYTDDLEIPLSFNNQEEARALVHQIADCPIKVQQLFGYYAI